MSPVEEKKMAFDAALAELIQASKDEAVANAQTGSQTNEETGSTGASENQTDNSVQEQINALKTELETLKTQNAGLRAAIQAEIEDTKQDTSRLEAAVASLPVETISNEEAQKLVDEGKAEIPAEAIVENPSEETQA